MSGPARTALITVEIAFKVTDTATEGEMLDAVVSAVREVQPKQEHPGATIKVRDVTTHVTTISTGGSL
jgi:hypothetical protein